MGFFSVSSEKSFALLLQLNVNPMNEKKVAKIATNVVDAWLLIDQLFFVFLLETYYVR